MELNLQTDPESTVKKSEKRLAISRFTIKWLYSKVSDSSTENINTTEKAVMFSEIELLDQLKSSPDGLFDNKDNIQLEDVEEALLYLSLIHI